MPEARTIHYKRRWFYVMWCGILLASLAALVLWETPVRGGTADLTVRIQITNAPPGCTAQVWAGPQKHWPTADLLAPLNQVGAPLTAEGVAVGSLKLKVGYRRWVGGAIPHKTDDLLIVKFQPKAGPPRYFALPLDMDWHTRLLRPGQRMGITTTTPWDGLWQDPATLPKRS